MLEVTSDGDFHNLEAFLERAVRSDFFKALDGYGKEGVQALSANTPRDSGRAATSWSYEIKIETDRTTIQWINTDNEGGYNVIILLQYGHGTGTGGYVQGRDIINPTMKPIFDRIADQVWKAVTSK